MSDSGGVMVVEEERLPSGWFEWCERLQGCHGSSGGRVTRSSGWGRGCGAQFDARGRNGQCGVWSPRQGGRSGQRFADPVFAAICCVAQPLAWAAQASPVSPDLYISLIYRVEADRVIWS
eukprot:1564750-Prymnesium_polylepis.2